MEKMLNPEAMQWMSQYWWALVLFVIWTLPWKGVALWRSARNRSLPWFIVFLLVNTIGILEIIYIFGFSKKKK